MKRDKIILIVVCLMIFSLSFVSAKSMCFPNSNQNLCKDSFEKEGYFYCDIEEVDHCKYGCQIDSGEDYCLNFFQKIISKIKIFFQSS